MKSIETHTTGYSGGIDILRFIACMIIVCHHSYMLTVPITVPCVLLGGWIYTDCFFMITGIFMVESIKKLGGNQPRDLLRDEVQFLSGKIRRIYPYFITAFCIEFLLKQIASRASIVEMGKKLVDSVWTILLVYMLGFEDCGIMGVTWFISSMLIALAILFPIAYFLKKNYVNLIAPAIVIIVYMFLDMYTGGNGMGEGAPREWLGICYKGTLRAVGGIALGAMVWSAAEMISSWKRCSRALLTVLEVLGYGFVTVCCREQISGRKALFLMAILACSLALTKSGATYSARLPEKLCRYLGRLSLSVYLCQLSAIFFVYCIAAGKNYIPYEYSKMFPVYLMVALALGAAVDAGVTWLIRTVRKTAAKVRKEKLWIIQ